jgi:hypothetical protein
MVRIATYFVVMIGLLIPLGLEAKVELQPHRAYYTVTLAGHPDPQKSIADVRGTMMVEFNKAGDGWAIQQLSEIWRYYNDGSVEHVRWGYVTWEAEDGSLFKFNTFRKINDELVEDLRGQAKKKGTLVEVIYQKPEQTTVKLPENVLFPVHHTKALLEAAQQGEHIFPQVIFDGSTAEGASEVNTFIGEKKVMAGNPNAEGTHQLASQPFWPVRFAVYGLGETSYEPNYITTQDLLPNGIIKKYVIDNEIYGVLDRIELLNENGR